MGSDGTIGIREIKGQGGCVFIQEPSSAKFEGMPRSAIESGLVDVVLTIETLPSKIISYIKDKHNIIIDEKDKADELVNYFDDIIVLLRSYTGHDFSLYKKNTVQRRIERCMGIHKIDDIALYVSFLKENPQELKLLFKEFLIGVTGFFREPLEWN